MRITLDLPDDVLQRAKITAVERGSSLYQLVIDAIEHEIEMAEPGSRHRMTGAPVRLSADAPLRTLSPDTVKRLDAEAVPAAEAARANAVDR